MAGTHCYHRVSQSPAEKGSRANDVISLLIHVFVYIAGAYAKGQGNELITKFTTQELYIWGLVAGCPMVLMVFLAWSPIRRAFYDVFLQVHRALAIVSIIGIWRHINSKGYYEISIVFAIVAIWAAERTVRVLRLLYSKFGHRSYRDVVQKSGYSAVLTRLIN